MRTRKIGAVAITLGLASTGSAGDVTVGLLSGAPEAFAGYTLFTQLQGRTTYLTDNDGRIVNAWQSLYAPGNSQYLLDDGHLLRTGDPGGNPTFAAGGDSGIVEEYDWDGTLVWSFLYSDATVRAHHDVAVLPNGNILILAWEFRSTADAIAAGRNPATVPNNLWPEHVVEIEPFGVDGGTIVWEWHLWDHLVQDHDDTKANFGVVADHPELIDLNYFASSSADWIHANAIDYNPQLDQILINSPRFHEFWIIDHSTTTVEAAGHTGGNSGRGGDILYRWGNPQTYDTGAAVDQKLFGQHDAHWIDAGLPGAGHIIVFNNGAGRPAGAFSTIEEIAAPVDGFTYTLDAGSAYDPAAPTWIYTADPPASMFSSFISGCQRQPNGNTLICAGASGDFREVQADGTIVWRYVNPVNSAGPIVQGSPPVGTTTFRAERYAPGFPGFAGRDLTPGRLIEIYPGDATGDAEVSFADILAIIGAWGPCPGGGDPCHGDVTRNGVVDFADVLDAISNWGPYCP
ncbi:MAG: arylsulfotransferase (ASST) [Planctomycetes bacterium]|nr:arylsulfotransferase (ASST) [Planctomycetota bacterium]